jgi:type IV pilus assembly protein PilB
VLPIQRVGDVLVVAMVTPRDVFATDDLRLASGLKIQPLAAPREELQAVIAKVLARMQ